MEKYLDLRSDTVTMPTPEMRRAMMEAEVGDDVYGDDPTVNRLEAMAAGLMGKEAAMFVVSGTMGNQSCIMTHTRCGDEIIVGAQSHIVHYECGAPGRLSGVNFSAVDNPDTYIYARDVESRIRPEDDPHFPRTALVCLENALCNGDVVPLDVMKGAADTAHAHGIPVHLDGARIFNAALALGVPARELAACADSVTFCISKGLCSPVGALVCGSAEFIHRARRSRKILGGGMRQAGVLAACGIVSLEKMVPRLHEDHENAVYLAEELNKIEGISADIARVKINMVFWKTNVPGFSSDGFIDFMKARGVKVYGILVDEYRFVTHNDVTRGDIDRVTALMREYIASVA